MLFAIFCIDKPDSLELRLATRADHLSYLHSHQSKLVEVGPLLDDGGLPLGSMVVVDAENREEAQAFAAADPYTLVGLFEQTSIFAYRAVFRNGQEVV